MKFLKKITLTKILIGLLALCLAGTCLVIFKGTEQNLHSDTATAVLLAREQLRTGRRFLISGPFREMVCRRFLKVRHYAAAA